MKAILVTLIVLAAAVSVIAYGPSDVAATIVSHSPGTTEPAALLLSGAGLLAAAGVLRRVA
jgi:hypothetical protein